MIVALINMPLLHRWLFLICQIHIICSLVLPWPSSNRTPLKTHTTTVPRRDMEYYDTIFPPILLRYDRSRISGNVRHVSAKQQTSVAGCGLLDRAIEDVVISQRWRRRSGTWGGEETSTWPLHSFLNIYLHRLVDCCIHKYYTRSFSTISTIVRNALINISNHMVTTILLGNVPAIIYLPL